jgi:WD40 repeat protein
MRHTQDPWLYCSVVDSAYDVTRNKAFTSGLDHSVKIWDIAGDGSTMNLYGTWHHDGVVNLVKTSPHSAKIATASDVVRDAIRVYDLAQGLAPEQTPFVRYSGDKANEQSLEEIGEWAYYPATIQWGKASEVADHLLVGYSPRSFDVHKEIPEDKRDSGDLCLWNTVTGASIALSCKLNVFEVAWHPSQAIFFAGTSAGGVPERHARTQVRIFAKGADGGFHAIKSLDCPALDINEILVRPNSAVSSYVTASCTDGKTYVWDSAREEHPFLVLAHGSMLFAVLC